MARTTSQFFTSKTTKASDFFRAGTALWLRGSNIGSIRQIKNDGKFYVSVVNSHDDLFDGEFDTFAQADRFAWISATSNKRAA